jgi:hypothetical protein
MGCQNLASWEIRQQAEYVARELTAEFDIPWQVVAHGNHYHVYQAFVMATSERESND